MQAQTYARRYTQTQITSVDHKRLLLLVFDGGLRFLRQAREALAAGETLRFAEALRRGQAIVAELQATLDFDRGGAIATQLFHLYDFMLHHLTEGNVQQSPAHLDRVIALLERIAGAYREIIERPTAA